MGIKDIFKRAGRAAGVVPAYGDYNSYGSIYKYLLFRGWTPEQIERNAVSVDELAPRTWGVVLGGVGSDGNPQVGVVYYCDYKYEEEAGGGDLRKAFGVPRMESGMSDEARRKDLLRLFDFPEAPGYVEGLASEEAAVVLGVEPLDVPIWGQSVKGKPRGERSLVAGWQPSLGYSEYAGFWEDSMRWSSPDLPGQRRWTRLEDHKVAELRQIAEDLGVEVVRAAESGRVLKSDYVRALEARRAEHVRKFPGWFQSGKALILRAGASEAGRMAQDVLRALWMAYRDGALGFGSGNSGPFSTGLSLLDVRDLPAGWLDGQRAKRAWIEAREAELEPVAAELKARGHRWYFLGRPTEQKAADGSVVVRYWLNGTGYQVAGVGSKQPYGYYSLEELRAEKFVTDLAATHGVDVVDITPSRW